MSRLTKDLRERMARCVLNNAFDEKQAAAKSVLVQHGEVIYQDIYGPYLEAMHSLLKHYLYTTSIITVAIAGQRHDVSLCNSKPVGDYQRYYNEYGKMYVGDEQIALDYLKAANVVEDLKKQRSAMEQEVKAILNSVPNFKKLWEVWPECKTLLEKFVSKPSVVMLPAIQFDKVNAALGLPVETEEHADASA